MTRAYRARPRPCSVTNCTVAVFTREMCACHYFRWRRHGNPLVALKFKPRKVV